eukprot:2820242-Rhodomonas_salina.1
MLSKHKPVVDVGLAPPMRGAAVTEKRVMHTPAVVQAPERLTENGVHGGFSFASPPAAPPLS